MFAEYSITLQIIPQQLASESLNAYLLINIGDLSKSGKLRESKDVLCNIWSLK